MRDISTEDCARILIQLKKNKFFSGFLDSHIIGFINKCKLDSIDPNETIWRKSNPKLDFKILLNGCLIVWNDDFGEDTTDALITSGQIIGEFEFLGKKSKSSRIKALTDCELLISSKSNVEELCEVDNGIFYRNLSKSLVDKMQSQNTLHKFWNFDSVDKRLIYFLDNFTSNLELQKFTNLKNTNDIEEFEINIFWTKEVLPGLLSTEMRSLSPYLEKHISNGNLEINAFNLLDKKIKFERKCEPKDFAKKSRKVKAEKGEPFNADFFTIKVLDYRNLTQIVEV